MDKANNIALSDSHFYRRIIDKYQKGEINPLRFPVMIFFKNRGDILSHNIDVLLQLYLPNWKIVRSLIIKSVQNMERLFSWLSTGKLIPEFMVKQAVPRSVQSVSKIFTLIQHQTASRLLPAGQMPVKSLSLVRADPETPGGHDRVFERKLVRDIPSVFSSPRNMTLTLRNGPQPLFPTGDALSDSLASGIISAPGSTVNRQHFNYANCLHIRRQIGGMKRPTASCRVSQGSILYIPLSFQRRGNYAQKENLWELHSPAGHKPILPQVNLLQNKSSNKTFQNRTTLNGALIKHYHYNFGAKDVVSSVVNPRRTPFKAGDEDLYFHNQPKIEQEFKEIKKIVAETKEAVAERFSTTRSPVDIDITRRLDMSRLSDHVYQKIEQRIRIERERRGL